MSCCFRGGGGGNEYYAVWVIEGLPFELMWFAFLVVHLHDHHIEPLYGHGRYREYWFGGVA